MSEEIEFHGWLGKKVSAVPPQGFMTIYFRHLIEHIMKDYYIIFASCDQHCVYCRNENHYLSLLSFGTVVTGKHLYNVTLNTRFTYALISQPEVYFPYIRLPLKINQYLI